MHKYIHDNVEEIPVPSDIAAQEVFNQLVLLEKYGALKEKDSIEKRLMLLITLFDYIAQPTSDAFRRQLELVREFKKRPP